MAEVIQKYYKDDEVILVDEWTKELLAISFDDKTYNEVIEDLKKIKNYKIVSCDKYDGKYFYRITYIDIENIEKPNIWILKGLHIYENAIKKRAEKVDKIVAGAFDLRQKTWGIFLNIYEEDRRTNEYYPIHTKEFTFEDSSCDRRTIKLHVLGKLCILQETTTSFVYLRERIKYYMDKFGYSKDDIIVGEILPMDHKVTPLK